MGEPIREKLEKSEKIIHKRFVELGRQRNRLTYQLLAILPEIYEQGIFSKAGYESIFEYAGKLAGLSYFVVEKTLRVAKLLKNKPCLQQAIATQGIHKVALVAKIATPENERVFADKVQNMSKQAVFELAREVRGKQKMEKPGASSKCLAAESSIKLELKGKDELLFLRLKKKLGKNLSHKKAMRVMLKRLEEITLSGKSVPKIKKNAGGTENFPGKILTAGEKSGLVDKLEAFKNTFVPRAKNPDAVRSGAKIRRYINASRQREIDAMSDGRCMYPGCNNPGEYRHHRRRFFECKNHDSVIWLCKTHHEFVHNGLVGNELLDPENWRFEMGVGVSENADVLYRQYRRVEISGRAGFG